MDGINKTRTNVIDEPYTFNDTVLKSPTVSLIYVDNQFHTKLFTPATKRYFAISEDDNSKPITEIPNYFFSLDLAIILKEVIETKKNIASIHRTQLNEWTLISCVYLDDASLRPEGISISITDISSIILAKQELKENDEKLSLALKSAKIGTWQWDYESDVVACDATMVELFELPHNLLKPSAQEFVDKMHPDDQADVVKALQNVADNSSGLDLEFRVPLACGDMRHIRAHGSIYSNSQTGTSTLLGSSWDITERVKLENLAIESEGRKIALDEMTDGWWEWNVQADTYYFSPKFKAMFGYRDNEITSSLETWQQLIHPEDFIKADKALEAHFNENVPYSLPVRYFHKKGHIVWVICRGQSIRDKKGTIMRVIGTHTDITPLKKAESELHYVAHYDPLTSLPNRRLFLKQLQQSIDNAKNKNDLLSVLFIDIDHFKKINDRLGHRFGDAVLKEAAQILTNHSNENAFIARLGGDEFAIIIENISRSHETDLYCEKLVNAFREPLYIFQHEVSSTISIGISTYPTSGDTIDTLIQHADMAMYDVKRHGKNGYKHFNNKLSARTLRINKLEDYLQHAIEKNELSLRYQPLINLESNNLIGFEVLLRWKCEELGAIKPDEFIPIAESSRSIFPIGKWVIAKALEDHRQLSKALNQPDLKISINISMVQLSDTGFSPFIKATILKNKLNCNNLILELTESAVMHDPKNATLLLNNLSKQGITFALDDFGNGYSSMRYLKLLPISILKIEKSFIQDLGKGQGNGVIIKAILSLAKGLGVSVIAEGVEKLSQSQYLHEQGCQYAQGLLYGKPQPIHEILKTTLNEIELKEV